MKRIIKLLIIIPLFGMSQTNYELPIESRDDFYILSNNLIRYLNSHTFGYLNISKGS